MDKRILNLILIFILVITGVYFLGRGITGYVISQSCCFLPNCAEENICPAAILESPMNYNGLNGMFILIGILFLISIILFVKLMHKK